MQSKSTQQERSGEQKEPGSSWTQNEEQVLPKNKLGIVSFALVCTMFLGVLDLTIVATALPTIVADLKGGKNYSWVGSAYLLSAGAFGPLYGKLSDMFGRKPLIYSCIAVFLLGSMLCGAAQNMTSLIVSRAIQGIGGGGFNQLSMIIISDIVPLKERGRYGGLLGATFSIASVSGPLLGGVLSQHASWRWCFFINLPIGGIAATLLFFFLNVHPPKKPLRDLIAEFDFIGLFTLVSGIIFLLMGFNLGQENWKGPWTVGLLVVGVALLGIGGLNEALTKRAAILPPRLFKTRTTGCLLATAFLHSGIFIPITYYLPLFYQVLGSSATSAGIKTLPFILGSASVSVVSGFIVSNTGKNRPAIRLGSTLLTIGTGLMITLDYTSSIAEQELFPFIAAVGIGFLYQIPIVAVQAAMPTKDMATATSAFMLLRVLGAAVGLTLDEAIIASVLTQKFAAIPNIESLGLGDDINALCDSIGQVHLIPDATLRHAALHAWASSIATIWMVTTVFGGVALVLTLFLREYSVDRETVCRGEVDDLEKCEKDTTRSIGEGSSESDEKSCV